MKKYFLLGLVTVFLSAVLVSCEKTSTCECTVTSSYMGETVYSQTVTGEYDQSCSELEKNAKDELSDVLEELESMGGKVTFDCREK